MYFCVAFSQFRITAFTQSRTYLHTEHKKSIGPYDRQFDHSVKYLVSIKTFVSPSLSFITLPYPSKRTNPTPTHHTKSYSILRYSIILNLFIVHQYNLITLPYPTLIYKINTPLETSPICHALSCPALSCPVLPCNFWVNLQCKDITELQFLFFDFRRGSKSEVFAHVPLHTS